MVHEGSKGEEPSEMNSTAEVGDGRRFGEDLRSVSPAEAIVSCPGQLKENEDST